MVPNISFTKLSHLGKLQVQWRDLVFLDQNMLLCICIPGVLDLVMIRACCSPEADWLHQFASLSLSTY